MNKTEIIGKIRELLEKNATNTKEKKHVLSMLYSEYLKKSKAEKEQK